MTGSKNGESVTLDEVRDELRMSNRLAIARLALAGVQQKDIAAIIGRAESAVSMMFPTGLLRRLGKTGKASPTTPDN